MHRHDAAADQHGRHEQRDANDRHFAGVPAHRDQRLPSNQQPTNNAICSAKTRAGRRELINSTSGGTVPAASNAMMIQGSLQLNVASRIPSEMSVEENEKRRTFVPNVASTVSKYNRATSGNSGALSPSIVSTRPPAAQTSRARLRRLPARQVGPCASAQTSVKPHATRLSRRAELRVAVPADPGGPDKRQQQGQLDPGKSKLVTAAPRWALVPANAVPTSASDVPQAAFGPFPFGRIAPLEQEYEGANKVLVDQGIQESALEREPVQPHPHPIGHPPVRKFPGPRADAFRWRFPASGSRAAASGAHQLQRAQASVADDVHQGHVAQSQADLGGDDAHLRQRGERQRTFHVASARGRPWPRGWPRPAPASPRPRTARSTDPAAG